MVTMEKCNNNLLPTGVILPFAGDCPPEGFLICDGSSISRKQ